MTLHKKSSVPLRMFSVNVTKSAVSTFTEEILNGKLHFLCSVNRSKYFGISNSFQTLSIFCSETILYIKKNRTCYLSISEILAGFIDIRYVAFYKKFSINGLTGILTL